MGRGLAVQGCIMCWLPVHDYGYLKEDVPELETQFWRPSCLRIQCGCGEGDEQGAGRGRVGVGKVIWSALF